MVKYYLFKKEKLKSEFPFFLKKGLLMVCDVIEERGGAMLDVKWGDSNNCYFPLFPIIKVLDLKYMGLIYAVMWLGKMYFICSSFVQELFVLLGAWGIMMGYKFKYSCFMFIIPYWYVLLLDKTDWNNHSYLYGILALLFVGTCANRWW